MNVTVTGSPKLHVNDFGNNIVEQHYISREMRTTFGQKLKQIRLERDMSLEEMGQVLGTSKQVLSRYEKGLREPKFSTVILYAKKLKVNPAEFLEA